MQNKSFYFRVAATLAAAFVLSSVLMDAVFPTRTPLIRPNLSDYLKEKQNSLALDLPKLIPRIDLTALFPVAGPALPGPETANQSSSRRAEGESIIASGVRQQLATTRPRPLTPGLSVVNNADSYLTILKQQDAQWTGGNRTVGGRNIQIRVLSGQSLPPDMVLAGMGL